MKVIEHLDKAKDPLFSYEIIPPLRGRTVNEIIEIVERLKPYDPPFIDVTSHPAEAFYEEDNSGRIKRIVRKKRPGTISICGIIQNRFNIDTVPHLLCRGFTKEETEDALIELNYLGIHNILAIRGDETNYKKPTDRSRKVNVYAIDLVEQISNINRGIYMDDLASPEPLDFCIGAAGYPEKHFEAPNMRSDIKYIKAKVDAGAEYIVTQMFFDNTNFYRFVDLCRKEGISVPIIPGLKILTTKKQLMTIPKNFYVDFPEELVEDVKNNDKHSLEIGIDWCYKQCEDLLNNGIKTIHFYIMTNTNAVTTVLDKLVS